SYSDFGSSTNPQFALLWQPLRDWTLRASYSRSFRAPNFSETSHFLDSVYLVPFPDPQSSTGSSLALFMAGAKNDIQPEKASSTSAGIDFRPEWLPRLSAGLDFFSTSFRERVARPSYAIFDILANESVYASVVTRNPTPAQIAATLAYTPNLIDLS